jgi:hypothetical protein
LQSDWAIGVSDRSGLIKTPDRISERLPRGGLSVCAQFTLLMTAI